MQLYNKSLFRMILLSVILCLIFYVPGNAEIINETGSLLEFFSGTNAGDCAYNNWISHTSEAYVGDQVAVWEADMVPGQAIKDFAPPELDFENNNFGNYQVVDSLGGATADAVLADWYAIISSLIIGDYAAADSRLDSSWFAGDYDLVRLDDGGTIYYMLREVLNEDVDGNFSEDAGDDVTGSFDLSWGLYVFKPSAINSNVVIEVVHPASDFMAPHVAMDAFKTIDAGMFFHAAASRQKALDESSNTLSDPSRIERSPLHQAHKAAVDLIDDEFVIQVHSYDTDNHNRDGSGYASPSIEMSAGHANVYPYNYNDYDAHPNQPLMDVNNYFDILSLTPETPIGANFYNANDPVEVDSFLAANYQYYTIANYYQNGDGIRIPDHVDLPGSSTSQQWIYSHDPERYDRTNGFENWLHIEMDEFPNAFLYLDPQLSVKEKVLAFYNVGTPEVPTYNNFALAVDYYHPLYAAIREYFDGSTPVWLDVPVSVSGTESDLIEFTVSGTDYDLDPVTIDITTAITGYVFNDPGNGTASFSWQTAEGDTGDYTATFTISDGVNSTDAIVSISITATGPTVAYASSETTVHGTVQGDYTNTFGSDNSYEILTEVESGGNPARNRYSYLEHIWTFQITGSDLELHAEAYRSANNDVDNFTLSGSFDGVNYTNMITVDSNIEGVYSANIDGIAYGNYYVKVTDTDHTPGKRSLDSFYLDMLSITYMTGDVPNQAPVWTDVPESITEYVDTPIEFSVTSSDPENDDLTITYAGDGVPDTCLTNTGNGNADFAWTPTVLGDYTVTFTLSDGKFNVDAVATISVVEPPLPGTMYVSSVDLTENVINKNISTCTGVITVIDLSDAAVEGAVVSASWSDLYSADVQGTTDANGQVTFVTENLRRPSGYYTLIVTNVDKATWTYDVNNENNVTEATLGVGAYAAGSGDLTLNYSAPIPEVVTLSPAYPNPFNDYTTIQFGLPEDSRVRVTIYDLLGKQVSILTSSSYQAGWHSIAWNPRLLANGKYIVRLEIAGSVKTGYIVFIK
jgi:hypothetical protein